MWVERVVKRMVATRVGSRAR